jgi:DNA polymerase-3 subunit gamma/tau
MPDSAAEHAPSPDPPGGQRTDPYRVLARTYRPQRLSELIGQEALVRTLTNALRTGRIAHAFLLTGIRGVGKTTTARIIARALNCTGPDGRGQPTPEPCGQCPHCVGIAEGRHIDVLEMDAATRTGIDDVRELVDSVRYAPTSARFKVYIVDEVHMLSEKAFNGLLKTLEEPPPQTIFIFATTEVRKVPITVLSRCQRFDLRRVEGERLRRHLAEIAAKEGVRVEPGALTLLVRAAEGSVRDGLSLLDQAIALLGAADGEAAISAAQVQDMLGLADRGRVLTLFEHLAEGDLPGALQRLAELYDLGTEPEAVLQDLLEICHWLTRIKVAPEAAQAFGVAEADARRGEALAARLTVPVLARNWQMLLKGLDDVRQAPSPLLAAEMVLVRLA